MNPIRMICSVLLLSGLASLACQAILVQPHNYMLDDSAILGPHALDLLRDQSDKDSDSLAGYRAGRMFGQADQASAGDSASVEDSGEPSLAHFSAEMAELIKNEQQHQRASAQAASDQEPSFSSSVAHVLMNVAQAAADEAAASSQAEDQANQQQQQSDSQAASGQQMSSADVGASSASGSSKLEQSKTGPLWYNPKETIPVLKISSMATPSKYKKVYFRSEKKLVDGAFHSPSQQDKDESKSFKRAFISSVQRRSSRGTSSSAAPPGILQDGVVEFLKKFRDVYVQTRPTGVSAASAAASSPFAVLSSFSSPSSSISGSSVARPTLMSALGALSSAASKVNPASAFGQAAAAAASAAAAQSAGSSSALASPSSSSGSSSGAQLAGAASNVVASVVANPSSSPSKSPLSAQTYVNFWSKTFPTWVRKMLKQMRRRSLQNHSKRQQNHAHQTTTLGQAAQAAANVAQAVEQASSGSHSSSSGHHHHH